MGSTTLGLKSLGEEREQETRATIGNGSIVIAGKEVKQEIITTLDENGNTITKIVSDNTDLIRGLNRDKDKSQQITKDMIIGALDGSMTVDNRIFTSNGRDSIVKDFKNFGGNTKKSIIGALSASETILEYGRKVTEKIPGAGIVVSQPFSAGEGFFDYFVENDSYITINGEKIYNPTAEQLKSAKDYYVNGIMNKEKDVDKYSTEDNSNSIVRYNPTSGASGDLIESTLGKLFNWNGLTAQLGSMNRVVANDLFVRKDNEDSHNKFHSQGTIIGTGALNILNKKGIILNKIQVVRAVGPAVYETNWKKISSNIIQEKQFISAEDGGLGKKGQIIGNNIQYDHDKDDGVRKVTSPRNPIDPFVGIYNLITNMEKHNVSNPKYR